MAATTHSGKTIHAHELQGWSLLERFLRVLDAVGPQVAPGSREDHGLRTLDRRSYFTLFLLGLFNPVVSSMRALCAASALPRVQRLTGRGPVGLSRFSDAQQVFAPAVLQPVMAQLLERSAMREVIGAKFGRVTAQMIRVVDSTVWKVIPRMQWAHWRHQSIEQKALRLHVQLRLCDLQPTSATITTGKTCERAALRANLAPGEFYLGDRYYGEDYGFFEQLRGAGCGFVLRVRNEAIITVVREHPLSATARAQGVSLDAEVMLGSRHDKGPWRVVKFQRPGMKEAVILITSEAECAQLSAEEVMELYRHRWQVEMFFRWLKCLVPCRHWFAESKEGVTLQVYLALIEALLLAELVAAKPNKRMMELLQWHQLGWAEDGDLAAGLAREQAYRERRAAAKKSN
jgi:hypothetical protein